MEARARKTDPLSSHLAAREMEGSGSATDQRLACFMEVMRTPGQTAAEIADSIGMERHAPSRRLPELREGGLVDNGKSRICRKTKHLSLTWFPAGKSDL